MLPNSAMFKFRINCYKSPFVLLCLALVSPAFIFFSFQSHASDDICRDMFWPQAYKDAFADYKQPKLLQIIGEVGIGPIFIFPVVHFVMSVYETVPPVPTPENPVTQRTLLIRAMIAFLPDSSVLHIYVEKVSLNSGVEYPYTVLIADALTVLKDQKFAAIMISFEGENANKGAFVENLARGQSARQAARNLPISRVLSSFGFKDIDLESGSLPFDSDRFSSPPNWSSRNLELFVRKPVR